ncbi:hypothetical protein Q4574_21215 [Aliiglaciecola sp. 3_MG-2023]|uniref:hypothetical protein n=1 Tax=Aliiglaciecola sp. 3_MG-2023 TaxID=3062644 RepID=UPI0026E2EE3C|nr:hypothetical protein [Aliiglaciecola sp. 3_MG-2023]MDO6695830.1 hypothetical protein [Aliiglaciecola sp. 3_MG-2023]
MQQIRTLYASEDSVKKLIICVLVSIINFSALSQTGGNNLDIDKLQDEEVVLKEILFLYKLGEIRKVAFDDGSFETVKAIDKVIYLSISDSLIYQPKFNKEYAEHILKYLDSSQYYQFTWSKNENIKLLNALKSI